MGNMGERRAWTSSLFDCLMMAQRSHLEGPFTLLLCPRVCDEMEVQEGLGCSVTVFPFGGWLLRAKPYSNCAAVSNREVEPFRNENVK